MAKDTEARKILNISLVTLQTFRINDTFSTRKVAIAFIIIMTTYKGLERKYKAGRSFIAGLNFENANAFHHYKSRHWSAVYTARPNIKSMWLIHWPGNHHN